MSMIELPNWFGRRHASITDERDPRMPYRVPAETLRELDRTVEDQQRRPPLGTPTPRPRTAHVISDEIEHLRHELIKARELVKQGEAKEAELVAELDKAINDELAAKQAAHDADVAELNSLRPGTGETP